MIVDPFEPPPAAPHLASRAAAPARYLGPFDREAWPETLAAHAVSADGARLHGYAVDGDLARFYGVADLAWLALCGELPTADQRAALDVALVLLAPVPVAQAPSHAAILSRIAGAPPAATIGIAAIGLGEQVRDERARLATWLAWLDAPTGAPPPAGADQLDGATRAWLDARLRGWFGDDAGLPDQPLSRAAAGYLILHRLGVRAPLAVEALAVWARLPTVIAEASHVELGAVRSYPARLPDYQYVDAHGATP